MTTSQDIVWGHGLDGVDALENAATQITGVDHSGCGANASSNSIDDVVVDGDAVRDQIREDLEDPDGAPESDW